MKKSKLKPKKKRTKPKCAVCIEQHLDCSVCRGLFKLGYAREFIENHHAQGLGLATATVKTKQKRQPMPIPDVGRLRGITRSPQPHQAVLYAAAYSLICPKPPNIKLEGIRTAQVLSWAEQWRDFYESYPSCGHKSHFLTMEALHNMVVHSDLPYDDHEDAHVILKALYPEEHASEAASRKREWDRSEARRIKEIADAKKKTEKPAFSAVDNEWGIPVENNTTKYKIFGHPVTAIIRWMGGDAWNEADARLALDRLGLHMVSDNTVKAQLRRGRDESTGDSILTADQVAKLDSVLEPKPKEAKTVKNAWKSKGSRGKGTSGKESKQPESKKVFGKNRETRRNLKKKGKKS